MWNKVRVNKIARQVVKLLRRYSSTGGDNDLKSVLKKIIPEEQDKVQKFRKQHGKFKVGEVTIDQMYGGMRGINALVWETSVVDRDEGIRFRGKTISDLKECLPKAPCGCEPLPEGLFWLLVTGKMPTQEQVELLSEEWADRSELPPHICGLLNSFPITMHPMTQLGSAMTALNTESLFAKEHNKGTLKKAQYWEFVYEDCMNVIAKLTPVAAIIYRRTFKGGKLCGGVDLTKDWSYNYCQMLGFDNEEFIELMRLYLTIHSDHEGGNVSAHTVHLVGSALSDPYLAYAAGMNGLAGPLHGLANQEVLIWLEKIHSEVGKDYDEKKLKDFLLKALKSGQVIPGYGHAVLRKTDPRFTCQAEFGQRHLPNDPMFKLVRDIHKILPPILKEQGKVQNPWPNVDAHSGALLQYYGMVERTYYTVLFAVSRALGVLAGTIWDRALGLPIERPKSMSTQGLMKLVADAEANKSCESGAEKNK